MLKSDSSFAAAYKEAMDAGIDALEDAAVRRAMHGTEEPVFSEGQLVGFKTVYSDALTKFILQGNLRKYREGENSAAVLSAEDRERLRKVFSQIQGGEDPKFEEEFAKLDNPWLKPPVSGTVEVTLRTPPPRETSPAAGPEVSDTIMRSVFGVPRRGKKKS